MDDPAGSGIPLSISIITPCYNRASTIREALESVLAQQWPSLQHIVVDGGSTDGTLDILGQYPHLQVLSEPDRGMYDAINKGIRMAQGEVIGLLNSDDLYEPGAFRDAAALLQTNPALDAVCGGVDFFSGPFASRKVLRTVAWIEESERWARLTCGAPVTNAWFFRKRLFERTGLFDDFYRYSADRDFLVRLAISGAPFAPLRRLVYHYRQHAGSYTINPQDSRNPRRAETRMQVLAEGASIAERYLGKDGLPAGARSGLRRYHTDRTYRLAATALYQRRWKTALAAARRGLRSDPLWLARAAGMGLRRLLRPAGQEIEAGL